MCCSPSLNGRMKADVEVEWWERQVGALLCTELQVRKPGFITITRGK